MYRGTRSGDCTKGSVAGIDTAVAISVLKTRNLVVREVHRTDGIFGSGVEDIGYLFQLVVRAGERFHVIVSAVISVHIFYLVNLVVVQIDLGQVDFLTESMYGTLSHCLSRRAQFHHLSAGRVRGYGCHVCCSPGTIPEFSCHRSYRR